MGATLQLITDQFRELKSEICTISTELRMDMVALGAGQEALRCDIGSIIEYKVGNCMSSITEGLNAEVNDLRSDVSALESKLKHSQADMEERFERQQKEVTSIMEQ
jgi:outer membrane murein-binding lipoprotein Lpp